MRNYSNETQWCSYIIKTSNSFYERPKGCLEADKQPLLDCFPKKRSRQGKIMILYFSYILYHSCRSQRTFIRLSHFELKSRFVFSHCVTYFKLSQYKTKDNILYCNVSGYEPNFVIRLIKFEKPYD